MKERENEKIGQFLEAGERRSGDMGGITAKYKKIVSAIGNRYSFYCDLSGALVSTTGVLQAASPDEELLLAWKSEGEQHFNRCHKCGKWVVDVMYNAEVLECVSCAPYEDEPDYCKSCGTKIVNASKKCPVCGMPLIYEGGGF